MSDGYKPNQPLDQFVMLGDATARVTNDLRARPGKASVEKSEPSEDVGDGKDADREAICLEQKVSRPKRAAKKPHQSPPLPLIMQRSLEIEFATRREFSALWPRPKVGRAPDKARTKSRGKLK